jgi:outer membrane protein
VDFSKASVETAKRDIVLQARVGYFNIIRADKFVDVGKQAVKQFEAQLEVTKAFFDVGIVPKNDVLQAEVRLANAVQALIKAENDLATAKASFNILLRREINTPFEVVDILAYKPFPLGFEAALEESLRQRPEVKAAQLNIDQAKENVKVAKSGFFPTISLAGNYSRVSDAAGLNSDTTGERWTIQALATLTLFDWGHTAYKVGENKVKVNQAEDSKTQLIESITLEVKDDYLNMLVAEKSIAVAQKSIEQAEENLRMNEERYKYQVATQTDVLDAVVLLAQARVNYYGALSDFNVAQAQLERAMGRMYP